MAVKQAASIEDLLSKILDGLIAAAGSQVEQPAPRRTAGHEEDHLAAGAAIRVGGSHMEITAGDGGLEAGKYGEFPVGQLLEADLLDANLELGGLGRVLAVRKVEGESAR
jgi:hypothetical protein